MTEFLDEVIHELSRTRGLDLSGYRRSMLERRLCTRLAKLAITDPAAYLVRLRNDPAEPSRLVEAVTVNVTAFFRNPAVWEILSHSVIRQIIERKQSSRNREIRVWSAGCATGEEPYSVAILLHEALQNELSNWKVHIFATDLSEDALRAATLGVYARDRMENSRLGILDRYFTLTDGVYEVRPFVRRMVWFSRDDLTSSRTAPAESIYGTFDLVLCRNVLIYFARPLQHQVLDKLSRATARNGYLVLGEAEVLDKDNPYGLHIIDRRNRIYQKVRTASGPPSAADLTERTYG